MSIFNELKRRNVFRVGIAYLVVAWLVMQVADVVINNVGAPGWVYQIIMLGLGIGFPVVLIFSIIYRMISAVVYGLVGMVFSSMVGARLSYPALMRLAAIAFTPAIVLNTAFTVFDVTVPYWWWICIALTFIYMFFAVIANAGEPAADDAVKDALPV